MQSLRLFTFLLFIPFISYAQLPQTEIWVFDIKPSKNGYVVSNPKLVKAGNGYNNQPYFTQNGEKLLFTSNGKKQGLTDIYEYRFRKKKIKRLTKTKREAEYSPMLTPDQAKISCVRVAADTISQQFCTYNLKGKKPVILFPDTKTFGYYCWRNQIELLAFHVPEPFLLRRHNIPYNKQDTLYQDIGRCIVNSRNKILYVDKSDSTDWKIKVLNNKRLGNRKYASIPPDEVISSTLKGEEDFALLRAKDLIMAKDGFIYMKKNIFLSSSATWVPVIDLNYYKLYNIYRVAVSPVGNKIAVVYRVPQPESPKENKK